MKNLVLHQQRRRNLQFIEDSTEDNCKLSEIQCTVDRNNLYLLFGNRLYIVPTDCKRDINSVNITKHSENSKSVGLEYCIIKQELYCAYANGDIARIDVTNQSHFEYEIVLKFDNGLQCMKLSPDHEIVTVVTSVGTVVTILLNLLHIISEVNLFSSDFGEKQFITVGWGKKDTQFHGSEGKAAAKAKPEQIYATESDSGLPQITWREDGTLFAVSFLDSNKIRQFKVFNREGILQYTSEPTNGLEECLAWKPSGNLIATTQRLVNKHVVALFEKNGLKHREFLLSFEPKEVTVKDLFWSSNSDILVIICEQIKTSNTIVQFWAENNYHWYLKQTIIFSVENPLIYATWNNITGRYDDKELILLTTKEVIFCSFNWCVDYSRGKTIDDKAVVGVIDGIKTLVTGFRIGIIPPPMSHHSLQSKEPTNAIVFAPNVDKSMNSNVFCTVSCNNILTFFKEVTDSSRFKYEVFKSCNIKSHISSIGEQKIYNMHHFLWLSKDIMLCSMIAHNHYLCVLHLDEMNSEDSNCLTVRDTYILGAPIEHIVPSPDADIAYIIANKSVLKYTKDTKLELEQTGIELRELCCQVEVIKIGSKDVIITLSYTHCFSIDGEEIANNVRNFYVHSEFLLLTTLQHTLICVPLNENGMKQLRTCTLTIKPWEYGITEKSLTDINIRRIERGSSIITALSQGSKVILQAPRGNLECIQPRALSLHMIGCYLDKCNYLIAFDMMRKERINLNLIFDHNPQLFMNNAKKFVDDIANPNWLNLFLSELQDEDFTTTMYANCYLNRSVRSLSQKYIESKVDKVCGILRDIMDKRGDANNFIQPILMTLVKNKEGWGLRAALERIEQIKELENSQESACSSYLVSSENALKYLLHIADINILYDTALGMYNLELTMFIASKSQKDPKEYIPFLNNLKKLDEKYMKYSIDMHLKRYESALVHLSSVPNKFEECLDLICKQNLYTMGKKLFMKNSTEYKRVIGAFGEYLLNKKKYHEAAIMFYKSENLSKALNAHLLAGNWEDVIIIIAKMKLSPTDSCTLYKEVVERLKTDRKYEDAAKILRYYLNDAEEAVALLCEGRCWKHAIRIVYEIRRLDLNETHIIPGINEHTDHVMSEIHRLEEDFIKHKSRLATVRTKINKGQMSTNDETIYNDGAIPSTEVTDLLSDMSSVADSTLSQRSRMSTASGRSYRSSKNRRKQQRKLFSLKEGYIFEDLGLIYALHQITSSAYKNEEEWYQLVQALIYFDFDEFAEKLQNRICQFFELIENSTVEIWNESTPSNITEIEKMGIYTPTQIQDNIVYLKSVEPYLARPLRNVNICAKYKMELDIF